MTHAHTGAGHPPVIPRPSSVRSADGCFQIGPEAGVRGPEPVVSVARQVLDIRGPGASGAWIDLRLVDDPALGAEGYRLVVRPDGIDVTAASTTGLGWGVQTLRQLRSDGRIGCTAIEDRPRHRWRGSLLDVARHCHPLPFLYRYVDLLALHKLNVLHLHLTDDQGWRFEVERYPRLVEVGGHRAGSATGHAEDAPTDGVPHGGSYTRSELRSLVTYALHRGVQVMPEVDAPGHVQALLAAYPELGNVPGRPVEVRQHWGISRRVLNVDDGTVRFMCDVLDELTDVFPFEFAHIGGDEVPPDEWAASPAAAARVAAEGLAGPADLVGWWSRRLAAHLRRTGRRAAVWDEVIEHGLPDDGRVFAWQGPERVVAALAAGAEVVAAPYQATYLDWREADGPGEPPAIAGDLPLERVLQYEPPSGVLGIQGQLWSEYLPTPDLVEWRAFPRLAAIAETGWSGGPHDPAEFRSRLGPHLRLLDRLGVNYRPLDGAGRAEPHPASLERSDPHA